jgi:transposase
MLEALQHREVRNGVHPAIAQLASIGTGSAWTLVKELFGWRHFHNRPSARGTYRSPQVTRFADR